VTTVAGGVGSLPYGLTFDGGRIWTANFGSVSIVTPGATLPWTVTTITIGFSSSLGALFDGAYVWVTEDVAGTLLRLDTKGKVVQTVTVGSHPALPIFDGGNIWVPNNNANSVSVVRASTGAILATLVGNGLDRPLEAAFDGERILVTNFLGDSVSLWKAADLTAMGSVPTGGSSLPFGACSDGVDFWITLNGRDQLARF
jgi:DNA-binding beta-propeller fold protein YncE